MLLILIPITWLSVMTLLVAVCHMAAHGDMTLQSAAGAHSRPAGAGDGLVVLEDRRVLALGDRRP